MEDDADINAFSFKIQFHEYLYGCKLGTNRDTFVAPEVLVFVPRDSMYKVCVRTICDPRMLL